MEKMNFEEIIQPSDRLEEEMNALRGGANVAETKCGKGVIATCNIGTDDNGPEE